ncbi:MAG TPA: hypothetical protein VMO52_06450 [Acidimicrobiia bacterium]|nr:hypothetical protein [Acidimicrobiia bacterium]
MDSHLAGDRPSEVGSKLVDAGLGVGVARATMGALGIELVDFDTRQAWMVWLDFTDLVDVVVVR